jgi:hypothetical protein
MAGAAAPFKTVSASVPDTGRTTVFLLEQRFIETCFKKRLCRVKLVPHVLQT